jgi:hypothetical protein
MADLIDTFTDTQREVEPGKWAIAKPLPFWPCRLRHRLKDAWGVLTGKYTAVFFAEDAIKWQKEKPNEHTTEEKKTP